MFINIWTNSNALFEKGIYYLDVIIIKIYSYYRLDMPVVPLVLVFIHSVPF